MTVADLLTDDKKAGLLAAALGAGLLLLTAVGELSAVAKAQLESAAYMLFSFVPIAFGRAVVSEGKKEDQDDANE